VIVLQIFVAVLLVALMILWPGAWNIFRGIGLLIALPAAILLIVARYQLGRSFSVSPQARQLVTHGLYSKLRNPMCVFSGLLIFGLALAWQKPVLMAIFAVLIPLQIIRARQEAKVLETKFGDAYRDYRNSTWF
jgi:protein-S-isoprenylcysteine O-methyltransferase Ste14